MSPEQLSVGEASAEPPKKRRWSMPFVAVFSAAIALVACGPNAGANDTGKQSSQVNAPDEDEEARDNETDEEDDDSGEPDTGEPYAEPELRPYNLSDWIYEGVGSNIASELIAGDPSFEPSGLAFGVDNASLWAVSNVGGRIAELTFDGVVRSNTTIPGDLEGVTKHPKNPNTFLIVDEDTSEILFYDIETGAYTGDGCFPDLVNDEEGNQGYEALGGVPFGHQPSTWPEDENGYVLVGAQYLGGMAAYGLTGCTGGASIEAITTFGFLLDPLDLESEEPLDDNSAIFYSEETRLFYALFAKHLTIVASTLGGEEIMRYENLPVGAGGFNDPEGIVVKVNMDTLDDDYTGTADAYIAFDDKAIIKYPGMPVTLQPADL
jgi:hypothetical protein